MKNRFLLLVLGIMVSLHVSGQQDKFGPCSLPVEWDQISLITGEMPKDVDKILVVSNRLFQPDDPYGEFFANDIAEFREVTYLVVGCNNGAWQAKQVDTFMSGMEEVDGVKREFTGDAVNYLSINAGITSMPYKGMKSGRFLRLSNEEQEQLSRLEGVDKTSGRSNVWQNNTISYKNEYGAFDIYAVSPDYKYVESLIVLKGRYLNDIDENDYRKVVVLGRYVI